MPDSEGAIPDDVPVADAAEQQRSIAEYPSDRPAAGDLPLEAGAADWQEQRETVLIDPDDDELGR